MTMSFKEKEKKLSEVFGSLTVHCLCGHPIIFTTKVDKRICSYCGKSVFRNKQIEFKFCI